MTENKEITLEALGAAAMQILMQDPLYTVTEADIRGNKYRVFANTPQTLPAMFAAAVEAHGDKEFLVYQDKRLSYRQLWSQCCRFANGLREELGIKRGDVVALAMRNYPEWCVAYMAVISLGATVAPLNAWWKGDELKYGLNDCKARFVICDDRRFSYIEPFKDELDLTVIAVRDGAANADYRLEDIIERTADDTMPSVSIDPDDDYCIIYTSGSTGSPKGVVLTHRGCLSAVYSWSFIVELMTKAKGVDALWGDNPGVLLAVPLFHVTGSHSIFLLSLVRGRRIVMTYRWDAKEAADIIRNESLTNFVGVPTQSFELLDHVGDDGLPSLIDVGSGGAKRPAEHVRKIAASFSGARASAGYGLSETNAIGCVISEQLYADRPDSTGRAAPPLTDIKIVKDGVDMAHGEVGEIWIRSPGNFRCYLNRPEETAAALTPDGWFRTGDLGYLDEQEFVFIVDRMKELIIRGGENVSCLEVENRVYEHNDIAEAAVFSVPDEKLGERVGLVVYPKDGCTIEPQALRDFMGEKLAGFKNPERIWISPQSLPRLGTAKFDKLMIRKIALTQPPHLSI